MNEAQAQAALYLCIVSLLSGLDFFVHDFRVSFSIRERKPEIVVSVSVFRVLWSKKRRIDSDNWFNLKPDCFVPSTILSLWAEGADGVVGGPSEGARSSLRPLRTCQKRPQPQRRYIPLRRLAGRFARASRPSRAPQRCL